jgi:hypothetical protein
MCKSKDPLCRSCQKIGHLHSHTGYRLCSLVDFLLLYHGFKLPTFLVWETKSRTSTPLQKELVNRSGLLCVDISDLLQECCLIPFQFVNSLFQPYRHGPFLASPVFVEQTLISGVLFVGPTPRLLNIELACLLTHLKHAINLTLSYLCVLCGALDLSDNCGIGNPHVTES